MRSPAWELLRDLGVGSMTIHSRRGTGISQEIFKTCAGQVLRQLHGGYGCRGSRGWGGDSGRQSPFHWAEGTAGMVARGIWGLEADKLGEEGEAGVQGVGRGRQAGLVHRIQE